MKVLNLEIQDKINMFSTITVKLFLLLTAVNPMFYVFEIVRFKNLESRVCQCVISRNLDNVYILQFLICS